MSSREHDWRKEAEAETSEFLDDVLEYFQENNCSRAIEFERWQKIKKIIIGIPIQHHPKKIRDEGEEK